jgi:hypothetical protein
MTREEVIAMAREAGFMLRSESVDGESDWWECFDEEIERFAKLVVDDYNNKHSQLWQVCIEDVVKAEREACAKLLEGGSFLHDQSPAKLLADEAAKAIRARGKV